tara:strand:- start:316 stop:648 length:333 start_codon:yes stop_codon:yes gene_type:complete
MAQIVKKYEFKDEQIVDSLIKNLGVAKDEDGNEYPTHQNAIVKIGFFATKDAKFDDELNEIEPAVLYDKFCVDVCWNDKNDNAINDWSDFEITIDNEGIHSFAGVKYISD